MPPTQGAIVLPELPDPMAGLWGTIIELGQRLPADRWALIGGQMVVLHGLAHHRQPVRVTRDIDVLADLLVSRHGIRDCVHAVTDMGFAAQQATDRSLLHRFVGDTDRGVIDIVAPDHSPRNWPLTTIPPRRTLQVDGGRQALERTVSYEVITGDRRCLVPTPNLLGALVLKAAAYRLPRQRPPRLRRCLPGRPHRRPPCSPRNLQRQ